MRVIGALVGTAGAVQVCDTYWKDSFMKGDNMIFSQDASGTPYADGQNDSGVYENNVQACRACVTNLISTKSCTDFTTKKCFASALHVDFESKSTEKISNADDDATSQDKLSGSTTTEWTYTTGGADGAAPEDSEDCGPVLYRFDNKSADKAAVDGACADQSRPYCGAITTFESCCMGTKPQNTLCPDGTYCCGDPTSITIGADKVAQCGP